MIDIAAQKFYSLVSIILIAQIGITAGWIAYKQIDQWVLLRNFFALWVGVLCSSHFVYPYLSGVYSGFGDFVSYTFGTLFIVLIYRHTVSKVYWADFQIFVPKLLLYAGWSIFILALFVFSLTDLRMMFLVNYIGVCILSLIFSFQLVLMKTVYPSRLWWWMTIWCGLNSFLFALTQAVGVFHYPLRDYGKYGFIVIVVGMMLTTFSPIWKWASSLYCYVQLRPIDAHIRSSGIIAPFIDFTWIDILKNPSRVNQVIITMIFDYKFQMKNSQTNMGYVFKILDAVNDNQGYPNLIDDYIRVAGSIK